MCKMSVGKYQRAGELAGMRADQILPEANERKLSEKGM